MIRDNKKVLVILLHKIVFPGIFFNGFGVGFQLVKLILGLGYHLGEPLFILLERMQFLVPEHIGMDVFGIEKEHPDSENAACQQVFIDQYRRNMFDKFQSIRFRQLSTGTFKMVYLPNLIFPFG